MASKSISDLNIRITASSAGLSTGVRGAQKELEQFENGLRSISDRSIGLVAKLGAAFAGLQLAGAAKDFVFDGVRLVAEAEQAEIAFTTFLGSGEKAKKLLKELQEFAAETPFQSDEIRDAGKQLLAFGIDAEAIPDTLRRIGDLSAGTGNRLGELAELYGKARVQGTLYAEDINQLTGRGINVIAEFAKQFGVAESAVKGLGSEGKITFENLQQALIDMTSEGGKFAGLTEKQSQSLAGQYSTLLDSVDALKKEFAQGLVPSLLDSVQGLQGFTDESGNASAAAREMGIAVGGLIGNLGSLAVKINEGFFGFGQTMDAVRAGALMATGDLGNLLGIDNDFNAKADEIAANIRKIALERELLRKPLVVANDGFNDLPDALEQSAKKFADTTTGVVEDAKRLAKQLSDQYATPFEKAENALSELFRAKEFGGLSRDTFIKGLADETRTLQAAIEELQGSLGKGVNGVLKGSFEDAELNIQARAEANTPGNSLQQAKDFVTSVIGDLRGKLTAANGQPDFLNKVEATTKQVATEGSKTRNVLNQVVAAVKKIPAPTIQVNEVQL